MNINAPFNGIDWWAPVSLSLWLHHTRCNCTETLRRIFFALTRRGTIKTIEAIFQLRSKFVPFFLFFLDMRMVVKLPSRFLNIVSFISFFSFLFLESRFELMSRIREDRVFKGIKVEEPPVRFRWSVSRFPLAYYRRHTFPAAFYLNGDKIGARDRYAKRGARFRQRVSRVAFKHLILLKKKILLEQKIEQKCHPLRPTPSTVPRIPFIQKRVLNEESLTYRKIAPIFHLRPINTAIRHGQ